MDNKPNQANTSDVIQVRYDKLNALREAGRDPFVITTSDRDCLTETIKNNFEEYENKDVCVAGRIMSKRGKGKVSFLDLHDKSGKIQILPSLTTSVRRSTASSKSGISVISLRSRALFSRPRWAKSRFTQPL